MSDTRFQENMRLVSKEVCFYSVCVCKQLEMDDKILQ